MQLMNEALAKDQILYAMIEDKITISIDLSKKLDYPHETVCALMKQMEERKHINITAIGDANRIIAYLMLYVGFKIMI